MYAARLVSAGVSVSSTTVQNTVTRFSITARLKISSRSLPLVNASTTPTGCHSRRLWTQPDSWFYARRFTSSSYVRHKMEPQKLKPNGDVPTKRKTSPVNIHTDRPAKLSKTETLARTENLEMSHDEDFDMETETDDSRLPALAPTLGDSVEWQATIENVVRNVVSIHFCQTCSFDTDPAASSEATGFVVDAERGYILTNRHVVGAGPFWGYCIFDNHEEVCSEQVDIAKPSS